MLVVTVAYKSGRPLDMKYYEGTHVPLVMNNLGAQGMERAEVRTINAAANGAIPPYQLMTSLYFPNLETFQSAMADPRGTEVLTDIRNFYPAEMPDIMIGEVL
jgi:uncharacterized protein (TIGR02118 family)